MSQDIADMPGIESALERFGTLEASSANPTVPTDQVPATRESQPADARPAVAEEVPPSNLSDAQNSDTPLTTDTRAAAEPKPAAHERSTEEPKAETVKSAEPRKPVPD